MNRLIIIGNGFDLAHHMKTSYCDFISDYLVNCIDRFYKTGISNDPLLKIGPNDMERTYWYEQTPTPQTVMEVLNILKSPPHSVVNFKSSFLEKTIDGISNLNWVDLENEYFAELLSFKKGTTCNFEGIKKLNKEFEFMKQMLQNYLHKQQTLEDINYNPTLTDLFCQPILAKEILLKKFLNDNLPQRIVILNFNYTNTLEKYKNNCPEKFNTQINYIHGQLNSTGNPIVFGFGDEYNKQYLEFEDINNKELLKHIKSFNYFQASNYHDLIRFTEEDLFQACIYGHSLGLSDRTMLKEIFENDNCISIKLFYHQYEANKNDYTDKTYDLNNHFRDKGIMRKKIVPFNLCQAMPQSSNVE